MTTAEACQHLPTGELVDILSKIATAVYRSGVLSCTAVETLSTCYARAALEDALAEIVALVAPITNREAIDLHRR